jgi:hypothetical protein
MNNAYVWIGLIALIAIFGLSNVSNEPVTETVIVTGTFSEPMMSCSEHLFTAPQYVKWECDGEYCSNGIKSCLRG